MRASERRENLLCVAINGAAFEAAAAARLREMTAPSPTDESGDLMNAIEKQTQQFLSLSPGPACPAELFDSHEYEMRLIFPQTRCMSFSLSRSHFDVTSAIVAVVTRRPIGRAARIKMKMYERGGPQQQILIFHN